MTGSYLICTLTGFFVGSIMFSQILPEKIMDTDIQQISDDHNPGATNVFLNCGPTLGLICLLLDVIKGFLPVFLAGRFLDTDNLLFGLVMAAPVLGHAIAPLHHFHGGKCIATAFGTMAGLLPGNGVCLLLLAVLYIIFAVIVKIHPNRVMSIVVFTLFGVLCGFLMYCTGERAVALGCLLVSATAIVKHLKYFSN